MPISPSVLYSTLNGINAVIASPYTRRPSKGYSLDDHVKFMVYAMLSSGRKWSYIASKKAAIENIFNHFDSVWIKKQSPTYFLSELKKIKCGNRTIKVQMNGLKDNIITLETIAKSNGGLVENYYDNMINNNQLSTLINELAKGRYKLNGMGVALVCEYLKYMYDCVLKPDRHTRRFIGLNRMGYVNEALPSELDTIQIYSNHSIQTGISARDIDTMVWSFCSNYCGEKPECDKSWACPLRSYCNH